MRLIAHRGNCFGSHPEYENRPAYVTLAISMGVDVEVDVWFHKHSFWLGHDEPTYFIRKGFLTTKGLWVHLKDEVTAYAVMSDSRFKNVNYFFHQMDMISITSQGYLWHYPENVQNITRFPNSIRLKFDYGKDSNDLLSNLTIGYGVCSDYAGVLNKQRKPVRNIKEVS